MVNAADHGGPAGAGAYLDALTGVRSGKRSFYPEYVRSAQRLEDTVRALDRICRALVRTADGPRPLVESVVQAAADHLQADWLLFAVADGALPAARPRFLLLSGGVLVEDAERFPADACDQLAVLRTRPWEAETRQQGELSVRVSMTLDGEHVGGIAARPALGMDVADTDLAILRVLANQAAVALHNSFLAHATSQLRGQTRKLSAAAQRQAKDLADRNAQLVETQRKLLGALREQVVDDERHRIARELHDSVAQDVLSAGMAIEVCRADVESGDVDAARTVDRLGQARDLTRRAVERLRMSIYALHDVAGDLPGSLPASLEKLSKVHLPSDLTVSTTVRGTAVPLPSEVEHALLRIAGEALFNTVSHTNATRAVLRLQYRSDRVVLTISDDGAGDPAVLRRMLRLSAAADLGGGHRGLANMAARLEPFDGKLSITRSTMGGIALRLEIPAPVTAGTSAVR